MSLATKYRPSLWADVTEQDSAVRILSRQLETRNIKNAYIFSGASGCGKTTTARIFANEINEGFGAPIEIDAASNNGVENVRNIIKSASERALDCEYKVIIIDECFTSDTLIRTAKGLKRICDITNSDAVMTPKGFKAVTKVHKTKRKTNLIKITLNNGEIIKCTENHLILTDCGWIEAKNLLKGDKLVDEAGVRGVWKYIPNDKYDETGVFEQLSRKNESWGDKTNKEVFIHRLSALWDTYPQWKTKFRLSVLQILFEENWRSETYYKDARKRGVENIYTHLCRLWEDVGRFAPEFQEDLFRELLKSTSIRTSQRRMEIGGPHSRTELSCMAAHYGESVGGTGQIVGAGLDQNVDGQSHVEFRECCQDESHEGEKWYPSPVEGSSWREWSNYRTSEDSSRGITWIISRVCREWLRSSGGISYMLQMRPSLSRDKVGDRGGWQFTSLERRAIARCQEGGEIGRVWVEDVEIYEPTDNGKSGECCEDYSVVYDLSVEGCPMYFANGVLVHNCHALTNQAWQAFLKCIEETPKYTIFIFCTTDPQKIPATILNRCMRFNFTRISSAGIKNRLDHILHCENIPPHKDVTDYISRICKGEMRNALSLLEQWLDGGDLSMEGCIKAIGGTSYDKCFSLINSIIDGDAMKVSMLITDTYNSGADIRLFVDTFTNFVLDLMKFSYCQDIQVTRLPNTYGDDLLNATGFENSNQYYEYYLDKLLELKNMLKGDNDPVTTIQIMMNRMVRLV